jgi:hypothetical protein
VLGAVVLGAVLEDELPCEDWVCVWSVLLELELLELELELELARADEPAGAVRMGNVEGATSWAAPLPPHALRPRQATARRASRDARMASG